MHNLEVCQLTGVPGRSTFESLFKENIGFTELSHLNEFSMLTR